MRAFVFCFLAVFIASLLKLEAQIIPLNNPSFEDTPSIGITPKCWLDCGMPGETPPDIQPNQFRVDKSPQHGNTYLGMVTRDSDTWEAVGQMLETPLVLISVVEKVMLSKYNSLNL